MHDAPSVTYPVGRFTWGYRCAQVLCLCMAAASTFLAQRHVDAVMWDGVLAGSAIVTVGLIQFQLHALAAGALSWAKRSRSKGPGIWLWQDAERIQSPIAVELNLVWLLQGHMCLVMTSSKRPRRLLWVSASHAPERWLAMRQAIWSHHTRTRTAADGERESLR